MLRVLGFVLLASFAFLSPASAELRLTSYRPDSTQVRHSAVWASETVTVNAASHDHELEDGLANSMLVYAGCAAFDQYSTTYCLKHNPRCYEANTLGFDAEARTALKFGSLALQGWVDWKLRRRGRHKLANVIRYTTLAAYSVVIANNFRNAHRR